MPEDDAPRPPVAPQAPTARTGRLSDKYTAVVFVHGMGRQSQYENLGRLLEALEEDHADPQYGILRQFLAQTEPSRVGAADDVPFMQFDRFQPRLHSKPPVGRFRFTGRYRAYEAYWSPVTARGAAPLRVAAWAIRQLAKPRSLQGASWRRFTHLRIARLQRLLAEAPPATDVGALQRLKYLATSLLVHIQRFNGHEGGDVREEPHGRAADWRDFAAFAAHKLGAAVKNTELVEIIARWDATRLPVEGLTVRMAGRLRLSGAALALFLAGLAWSLWRHGLQLGSFAELAALGIVFAVLAKLGGGFLAHTFSDVFIWNSDQAHGRDHARRQEVLARTEGLIEHIVRDEKCKRLVIVAHSLGTPIVLETLTLIGRRNEARAGGGEIVELSKLSHLFTLGSPIDKIFYFFQTRQARTYRAGRLLDDLRGSLSQEPFFRAGRQQVDWLNFWDAADLVSDPLYSPLGSRTDGAELLSARILNHQVENGPSVSAWRNHVGYLANGAVVRCIAEALFKNHTEAPVAGPSARDPRIVGAAAGAARWMPLALVTGATCSALGYGWVGASLAAAPALLMVLVMLGVGQQRRYVQWRARANERARSSVAVLPGD